MRATTIHGPGDIRVEQVPDAALRSATDALVRVTHACVCGSDLWAYRGQVPRLPGQRIGHEFAGVIEDVGAEVRTLRRGDRVLAPFVWADGTCANCQEGLPTSCPRKGFWGDPGADGGQGEAVTVPFADATLVALPPALDDDQMPAVLSLSDVMCTGHHGAVSAGVQAGSDVVVIGDGAVGLCAVLAARRLGAARIAVFAHHRSRARVARRFGADFVILAEAASVAEHARELTDGRGFPSVIEAVGTADAMAAAMAVAAPGGRIGFVGVPHGSQSGVNLRAMFDRNLTLAGGITPARTYIPQLLPDVLSGALDPAPIFDLTVGLVDVPDGYAAMDDRRALKTLIRM
ncbi:alcohol dehydrogenase catalytic domain-containing protein [Micromonospora sp. NPDC048835]|uniref:zinc-binding dehydrogenase n=1 Tax=Micromonospora sp. NPDC048835 TaxID=3155147 RepID=UPI0033D2FB50